MGNNQSYVAPDLDRDQITPLVVRDELLKCFESANREFVEILNRSASADEVRQQTMQFLTSVFGSCGASFDNPTKDGIVKAIERCKINAELAMGTKAADIIDHHHREIMKLVNRL